MARKAPTAPEQDVRLVPSLSSFDFLEGAFAAAQRTRRVGLGVVVVALATLTVLALLGLSALLQKKSDESMLAQTEASNQMALAQLAKVDNAGGMTSDQLSVHVRERQSSQKAAIGKEIDVVAITKAIRSSAPAGVDVTSIVFHDVAGGVTNAAPVSGETSPATTAPSTPAGSASGSDAIGTVEIKATMKSFALLGAWGNSVRQITGLVPGDPMWQSSAGMVSATLDLPVTPDGLTKRAQNITTKGR